MRLSVLLTCTAVYAVGFGAPSHAQSPASRADAVATGELERSGSMEAIARGVLNGNRVETNYRNHGEWSRWDDHPWGVWPRGTGGEHVDGIGLVIAAAVPGERVKWGLADTDTTLNPVILTYRTAGIRRGPDGEIWGWLPKTGHHNPDRRNPITGHRQPIPARSDDAQSWPSEWPDRMDDAEDPGWPGSWNGLFGKSETRGALETFYVMDDFGDKEYAVNPTTGEPYSADGVFYPNPADSSVGGLGLEVHVRTLQWKTLSHKDIVFMHHVITNAGGYEHDSLYVNLIFDGGIGQEEGEETIAYDAELDAVYQFDQDGLGTHVAGGVFKSGYTGLALLQTPGNRGLTGIDLDERPYYESGDNLQNDSFLWEHIQKAQFPDGQPADMERPDSDPFALISVGPIEMAPQASDTFVVAWVFGEDLDAFRRNVGYARAAHRNDFRSTVESRFRLLEAAADPDGGGIELAWDPFDQDTVDPTNRRHFFEGYRLYRGTDPSEPLTLIKQWDLDNGISGPRETEDGDLFDLGSDTGLESIEMRDAYGTVSGYTYTDRDGETDVPYIYAVTAYSRGYEEGEIYYYYPSESSSSVVADSTGAITSMSSNVKVMSGTFPTATESSELPLTSRLGDPYPNPFHGRINIPFDLTHTARVRLTVVDVLGRTVATLIEESRGPGRYRAAGDARMLAAGVYFVHLEADGLVAATKIVLLD